MKLLILPEEMRSQLKLPLGILCRGNGAECIKAFDSELKAAAMVVAVGDMTAFYLLEASVIPDLAIIDNKTKRQPAPEHVKRSLEQDSFKTVKVKNPPATLNLELIDSIKESIAGKERVKIIVEGEEDLATLPAILYAPLGSLVVYGQPNEGSVMVKVTAEKKEYIKTLISKMVLEE